MRLTLLYTANIAGDLALLPRLHTFLQRLRPPELHLSLLFDLGGACSDAVWHCRETGGRSTLIVLDGMGYHAANVAGAFGREGRDQLAEQVTMGLVDAGRDWLHQAPPLGNRLIRVTLRPRDEARLQVIMRPADSTRVEGNVVYLAGVDAGQIGAAVVDLGSEPALASAQIHDMPSDTPPNPSIAGTVEFVEAEARFFARHAR